MVGFKEVLFKIIFFVLVVKFLVLLVIVVIWKLGLVFFG